ncbi:MAG: SDR family NAD(P)-dependent oxidoreductase [Candidatus Thorarchaeota archaeon]
MFNFEKKIALVTGAGSPKGIGQTTAIFLAEHGADVVVSDILKGDPTHFQKMYGYDYGAHKGLEDAVTRIKSLGREALAITADITKTEEVKKLISSAVKKFGGLDILVNVAGGAWGPNLIDKYDENLWIKTFDVNLFGTFRMVKYALPHLIKKKGTIINISSIAAVIHTEYLSAYDASKAGIVSLTASLALEYGPRGVHSFAILPGSIQTELYDMELKATSEILNTPPDDLVKREKEICSLRRIGKPLDIAKVVAFLCSEYASFINGISIPVTGGVELRYPY